MCETEIIVTVTTSIVDDPAAAQRHSVANNDHFAFATAQCNLFQSFVSLAVQNWWIVYVQHSTNEMDGKWQNWRVNLLSSSSSGSSSKWQHLFGHYWNLTLTLINILSRFGCVPATKWIEKCVSRMECVESKADFEFDCSNWNCH